MSLDPFSPDSPKQVSALLFGQDIEVMEEMVCRDEDNNIIYIKSGPNKGKAKTKKVPVLKHIKGLGLKPLPAWKTKKGDFYQTNEKILQQILGVLK